MRRETTVGFGMRKRSTNFWRYGMGEWNGTLFGVGVVFAVVIVSGLALLKSALPKLLKGGMKRFASGMIGAKAAALKGATMEVHSLGPSDGPQEHFDEEDSLSLHEAMSEDRGQGRWVSLEVTVTPVAMTEERGFVHWEPEELSLTPTPVTGSLDLETLQESTFLECFASRVRPEGEDTPEDEWKIQGPARVKMTAFIPSETTTVSVHYYTELVGDPLDLDC